MTGQRVRIELFAFAGVRQTLRRVATAQVFHGDGAQRSQMPRRNCQLVFELQKRMIRIIRQLEASIQIVDAWTLGIFAGQCFKIFLSIHGLARSGVPKSLARQVDQFAILRGKLFREDWFPERGYPSGHDIAGILILVLCQIRQDAKGRLEISYMRIELRQAKLRYRIYGIVPNAKVLALPQMKQCGVELLGSKLAQAEHRPGRATLGSKLTQLFEGVPALGVPVLLVVEGA